MSGSDPARILLIQLHHLGDVVLTTPTIRAARNAFPNARIDFLTSRLGAHALDANPHLDNILVEPSWALVHRRHYDVVADMHSVPRTALYAAVSRASQRIGIRGRGPRNLAYTQLLPREPGPVYMARQKLRLLEPLGVETRSVDVSLEIALDELQRAFARALLAEHGLTGRVVALSPVAKHGFKQWGLENWAHVADALAAAGAQVLITSGPGEADQARSVADAMKHRAVWQYGPTTVRQLAALYEQCALWLGNDGGPKHIAAAVGVPTISIVRRKLGPVWNDVRDPKQIAIESSSESLAEIEPRTVIAAALARLP